ncbi:hypothetical protein AB0O14_19170 [Microbacterium foliorum]|uniref:hypothetical protein n=1 Tax=Rothia terrae TaxID=396015 RepID=UPI00341CC2C9
MSRSRLATFENRRFQKYLAAANKHLIATGLQPVSDHDQSLQPSDIAVDSERRIALNAYNSALVSENAEISKFFIPVVSLCLAFFSVSNIAAKSRESYLLTVCAVPRVCPADQFTAEPGLFQNPWMQAAALGIVCMLLLFAFIVSDGKEKLTQAILDAVLEHRDKKDAPENAPRVLRSLPIWLSKKSRSIWGSKKTAGTKLYRSSYASLRNPAPSTSGHERT